MSSKLVTFVVGAAPPPRLDKALARDVPEEAALSRTRLARLIEAGAVHVNGAVLQDAKARVAEGDEVQITIEEAAETHMLPEHIPLEVAFEDDDLIVVNKPAGMVVHPAPGTPSGTLVNALLAHCGDALSGVGGQKRPGIVHRIDKDTSGLLVVAKTDMAHSALSAQFADHSVDRRYQAFCYGVPDAADPRLGGIRGVSFEPGGVVKITTHLARHKTDRQKQAVLFQGGRHAITRVKVRETFGEVLSWVECALETGRTHQIRVHMTHAGHALVGDPVYGGKRKLRKNAVSETAENIVRGFDRQALHAGVLGFVHPRSGETLHFEAPMPTDMAALHAALRA
ncbi:MAG: RluA family pseudouridine synthase [Rhodobacteraceae bacterium]|nr:RluA family pseudouridine synthase [Paracoccaceae bacterium]